MNATQKTEIDRNIENLRQWLQAHEPREDWNAGQWQAYDDRLQALSRWIAIDQRIH